MILNYDDAKKEKNNQNSYLTKAQVIFLYVQCTLLLIKENKCTRVFVILTQKLFFSKSFTLF